MCRLLIRVAAVLAILVVGIVLGGHPSLLPSPVRDALTSNSEQRRFATVLDIVEHDYYRKVPASALTSDAIKGMIAKLGDPYSRYLTAAEYRQLQQVEQQRFVGIGVGVTGVDEGLRIGEVYPGSPARAAGLRAGEIITAAGTRSLAGMSREKAVALVKGPEGTSVRLGILGRDKKRRTVTVERREVTVPQVEGALRTRDGRRYRQISVSGFTQSDLAAQVRRQLDVARREGVAGLVLDLRENPGGFIDQAQAVASLFLPHDAKIVTTKGRSIPEKTLRATGKPVAPTTPMVVLVDRNSASAAEIVAGALQDDGRAQLVGTRTYGKGVFQSVYRLRDGGALNLTTGQYFTPNGTNLGGHGVDKGAGLRPNVKAEDDPETPHVDEALQKALATLAAAHR